MCPMSHLQNGNNSHENEVKKIIDRGPYIPDELS